MGGGWRAPSAASTHMIHHPVHGHTTTLLFLYVKDPPFLDTSLGHDSQNNFIRAIPIQRPVALPHRLKKKSLREASDSTRTVPPLLELLVAAATVALPPIPAGWPAGAATPPPSVAAVEIRRRRRDSSSPVSLPSDSLPTPSPHPPRFHWANTRSISSPHGAPDDHPRPSPPSSVGPPLNRRSSRTILG